MALLHELKKAQLQERFTFVPQDSIGHLQTLWMSVLQLGSDVECEWEHCSMNPVFGLEYLQSTPKDTTQLLQLVVATE